MNGNQRSGLERSRTQRLRECEKVLAANMEEFVRVGLALKEIRDERLYKDAEFERFEDYCRQKWELSKSYAHNVIGSAELRTRLPSPMSSIGGQTWTERSVREFKRLDSPTKAKAAKFVKKYGVKYKVVVDPNDRTTKPYKIKVVPTYYLIGADGRFVDAAHSLDDELEDKIARALAKAK